MIVSEPLYRTYTIPTECRAASLSISSREEILGEILDITEIIPTITTASAMAREIL